MVKAVTETPARLLGRSGVLGCLRESATADLVHLQASEAPVLLQDCHGETRQGPCWQARVITLGGDLYG